MVRWQLLVLGIASVAGVVALVRTRVLWLRGCVAAGLLGVVLLQLFVTPLDRRIAALQAEIASLPTGHPEARALASLCEKARSERLEQTRLGRLPFRLGLDLRGGTEIRLRLHPDRSRVERLLREQQALIRQQTSGAPNPERQMEISRLADGVAKEQTRLDDQLAQAVDIVRYRLTGIGVGDVAVRRDGKDRILIQLPDMDSREAEVIVQAVEQQGVLEFRMIVPRTGPQGHPHLYAAIEAQGLDHDTYAISAEGVQGAPGAATAEEPFDWLRTPDRATEDGELRRGYFRVVAREAILTGSDIVAARAAADHRGENWRVQVEFDPAGAQRMLEVTRDNPGRQLGIVLDGRLVSAPHIAELVDEGRTEIMGDFAEREARDLAVILQSGALRVSVTRESQTLIGPSLGEDSIRRGVLSLMVGLAAVVAFMVFIYRGAGVIAVTALAANLAILAAILSWLDSAVALPGIAGGILLVGITVDSAVLIYERLREEQSRHASLQAAVHAAHDRAFTTIVDANLTTILAAGILYLFAPDTVKGFCLVLVIGILTGLFCSLVGIRWMLDGVAAWRPKERLRMIRAPRLPAVDFVKAHRRMALLSLILIIGSVGLFAWLNHLGQAFGTEFTGGTRVQFRLPTPQQVATVRERLQSGWDGSVPAMTLRSHGPAVGGGGGRPQFSEFSLTVGQGIHAEAIDPGSLAHIGHTISRALADMVPNDGDMVQRASQVGPLVAREMRQATLKAVALSLGCIFLYIVFRFRRRPVYGWVAVLTLVHDVIITVGVLLLASALGWVPGQIDLKVAAALLTVIGYSLNDTIVVFDRIRERADGASASRDVVNASINQVFLRALITSFTTLLVVVALLVLGGEVLRGFAFTLLVGIVVGTYSSLFMAGPLVAHSTRSPVAT
ncbi:MAG: protein translocase subunit SecD [Kiritimatiellia bacterium]|nr:protein translocase subunit SecD [Kiritimatiellia bacterium]